MGTNAELRERLRRLGLFKSAAHAQPRLAITPAPARNVDAALEALDTPLGSAYRRRRDYPLAYCHGTRMLSAALGLSPEQLAGIVGRDMPALSQAVFLDLETTGLSSAAGTLAFLVGLGYVEGEQFVVEQFFLRDPAEEAAMLFAVEQRLRQHPIVVSFNGQAFDLPLLAARFTLARLDSPLSDRQHLDLLTLARRLWRTMLGSCSLSALEFHLLSFRRTERDVPSAVIPFLYREYLASGGVLTEGMMRVMYHNMTDILSMVVLAGRLAEAVFQPGSAAEYYAAGRYHERLGNLSAAERCYRSALAEQLSGPLRLALLRRLARLLKRRRASAEATELWQYLADQDDVEGLVELAKHHEWRTGDLGRALAYARRARMANTDPALCAALDHRIARLTRKQAAHDHRRSHD
jgi:tetratricopeptide (TPR) repeat protein